MGNEMGVGEIEAAEGNVEKEIYRGTYLPCISKLPKVHEKLTLLIARAEVSYVLHRYRLQVIKSFEASRSVNLIDQRWLHCRLYVHRERSSTYWSSL